MRNPFAGLFEPRSIGLVSAQGRVWCPRSRDIDVDRCVGCPNALEMTPLPSGEQAVRWTGQPSRPIELLSGH